jgi:hypothetical protein
VEPVDIQHAPSNTAIILIQVTFCYAPSKHQWRAVEGRTQHLSNLAAIDDVLDFLQGWRHTLLKSHDGLDALVLGDLEHLLGLVSVACQRPLAEHILAGFQAGEKGGVVLVDAN